MAQYSRNAHTPVGGAPHLQKQHMATQSAQPNPSQPARHSQHQLHSNTHKRQMQQFYLHKSFDLSSDAEFLPSIPSDPIATVLQFQGSMNNPYNNNQYTPNMATPHQADQMAYYGAQAKTRRFSGQFLHQHLFGGKRNDYAQYKSDS